MMIKVNFVQKDGSTRTCEAQDGQTVMEIAKKYDLDMEGACGGAMACSTCHVIVDPSWYNKLEPATMDETDMLDLAAGLTRTSRLGCQIKLTDRLDGLTVSLPK